MAHGEDIIKKVATLFYERCEYDGQKPKVSNNGDLVIDVIKKNLIELIEIQVTLIAKKPLRSVWNDSLLD